MRKYTILYLSFFLLAACQAPKRLTGKYGYSENGLTGTELNLATDSTFTYFLRSEMGLINYSKGRFTYTNGNLNLQSFYNNPVNLKRLESKITVATAMGTERKIIPEIPLKRVYIIYAVKVDDTQWITFDKPLVIKNTTKSIQIKAYQDLRGGLAGTRPTIDTLSSKVIDIGGLSGNRDISVLLDARSEDFYRVNLSAKINVNGNNKLTWGKAALRRLKN